MSRKIRVLIMLIVLIVTAVLIPVGAFYGAVWLIKQLDDGAGHRPSDWHRRQR